MATDRPAPLKVKTFAQAGESATHCPATTAKRTSATPMADASRTRPGRTKRRYRPRRSAIGIVIARVKVPQGDDFKALTTTSATTARRMIMIQHGELGD